jgi:hypothetical protein
MRYFLVEIPVLIPDRFEMERATRTLNAAQFRLSGSTMAAGPLIAAVLRDSGRLVCLIEAPSIPDLRRLIALALLPVGRIREISHFVAPGGAVAPTEPGLDPTADLGPRVEPKLVEDVVDVGLDGSLGDE